MSGKQPTMVVHNVVLKATTMVVVQEQIKMSRGHVKEREKSM